MTLRSTDMTGGPPLCGLRSSEKNPFPIYVKVCCMNKEKIVLCDRKACTGCSACYATCPTGAVCMEADEEGFFIPRIDYDRCTGCQRCNAVCPVLRRNEPPADIRPLVLAAWHRDKWSAWRVLPAEYFRHWRRPFWHRGELYLARHMMNICAFIIFLLILLVS